MHVITSNVYARRHVRTHEHTKTRVRFKRVGKINTVKHIVFWFDDTNERCYSKALDGLDSTAKSSSKLTLLKKISIFASCPLNAKCQQLRVRISDIRINYPKLYNRFSR